jgi:hypothetical protein
MSTSYRAPEKDAFATPADYLASLPADESADVTAAYKFISARAQGEPQSMYRNIIGFGADATGWMKVGLCARRGGTAIYTSAAVNDRYTDRIKSMRSGKGCLMVKSWAKADKDLLGCIIDETIASK